MDCLLAESSIVSVVYKEIDPAALKAFFSHIEDCGNCRKSYLSVEHSLKLFHSVDKQSFLKEPSLKSLSFISMAAREAVSSPKASSKLSELFSFFSPLKWGAKAVGLSVVATVAYLFTISNPTPSPLTLSQNVENLSHEPIFHLVSPLTKVAQLPTHGYQPVGLNVPEDQDRIGQYQGMVEADADDLLMRGRRLKAAGRVDLALKDFETITQLYPQYSYMTDVLMHQAQAYALIGDNDQAIDVLIQAIQRDPSKKDLLNPMIEQLEHQ